MTVFGKVLRTLSDPGLNFVLIGGGNYQQLLPFSVEMHAFGLPCRCVTLERLVQLKRAAGRPKDFQALAELQLLLEQRARKRPRDQSLCKR